MKEKSVKTNNRWMIMTALSFVFCHLSFSPAVAQTFTQRIQKEVQGQGTVTIHHGEDIERLVNDPAATGVQPQKPAASDSKSTATQPARTQTESKLTAGTQKADNADVAANATETKTAHSTRKATGYRVQAFAGGNSRKDRQMAEQARNNIKAQYPNVAVYVHFYSPRWICRVGNYRTYEEAHQMMLSLQRMGYKQASIVKGKINVQY